MGNKVQVRFPPACVGNLYGGQNLITDATVSTFQR
jgi:hypothetical protein